MDLDEAAIRTRIQGWSVRASSATVDDEPDLGTLIDDWTAGMERDVAARFVDLAEDAYDLWQDSAKAQLAEALALAYATATGG